MATVEVCFLCVVQHSYDSCAAQTFESTLKEVVRAKRLSASKVKELTEIALKTMKVCGMISVVKRGR
jgi:hypothetical protein